MTASKTLPVREKLRRLKRKASPISHIDRYPLDYDFGGVTNEYNERFITISQRIAAPTPSSPLCVLSADLLNDPPVFCRHAYRAGVHLLSPKSKKAALEKAYAVKVFERSLVARNPGYTGSFFVTKRGDVITWKRAQPAIIDGEPVASVRPHLAFEVPFGDADRSRGDRAAYLKGLGHLLQGQDILTFALMVSLTAPLLRWAPQQESFGFQVVGSHCSGKTVAAWVAASAWDRVGAGEYIHNHNFVDEDSRRERFDHCSDQPVILDNLERWFALENDQRKRAIVRVLDIFLDHRIRTYGGTVLKNAHSVIWAAAREPLETLCGNDEEARTRLGGRIMAIPVPEERTGKIVAEPLPHEIDSSATLIQELTAHLKQHNGHAAKRFIRKALRAAGKNEVSLRARIQRLIKRFVAKAGVEKTDGPALLAASRFGLVYAAGELGRQWGAMPKKLDPLAAALACFNLYRNGNIGNVTPFADRLRALQDDALCIDLGAGKLPVVPKQERKSALSYVRVSKGQTLVYVHPTRIYDVFPDWDMIKAKKSVVKLQRVEREPRNGGSKHTHNTVKQKLSADRKPERVYCFRVPNAD